MIYIEYIYDISYHFYNFLQMKKIIKINFKISTFFYYSTNSNILENNLLSPLRGCKLVLISGVLTASSCPWSSCCSDPEV